MKGLYIVLFLFHYGELLKHTKHGGGAPLQKYNSSPRIGEHVNNNVRPKKVVKTVLKLVDKTVIKPVVKPVVKQLIKPVVKPVVKRKDHIGVKRDEIVSVVYGNVARRADRKNETSTRTNGTVGSRRDEIINALFDENREFGRPENEVGADNGDFFRRSNTLPSSPFSQMAVNMYRNWEQNAEGTNQFNGDDEMMNDNNNNAIDRMLNGNNDNIGGRMLNDNNDNISGRNEIPSYVARTNENRRFPYPNPTASRRDESYHTSRDTSRYPIASRLPPGGLNGLSNGLSDRGIDDVQHRIDSEIDTLMYRLAQEQTPARSSMNTPPFSMDPPSQMFVGQDMNQIINPPYNKGDMLDQIVPPLERNFAPQGVMQLGPRPLDTRYFKRPRNSDQDIMSRFVNQDMMTKNRPDHEYNFHSSYRPTDDYSQSYNQPMKATPMFPQEEVSMTRNYINNHHTYPIDHHTMYPQPDQSMTRSFLSNLNNEPRNMNAMLPQNDISPRNLNAVFPQADISPRNLNAIFPQTDISPINQNTMFPKTDISVSRNFMNDQSNNAMFSQTDTSMISNQNPWANNYFNQPNSMQNYGRSRTPRYHKRHHKRTRNRYSYPFPKPLPPTSFPGDDRSMTPMSMESIFHEIEADERGYKKKYGASRQIPGTRKNIVERNSFNVENYPSGTPSFPHPAFVNTGDASQNDLEDKYKRVLNSLTQVGNGVDENIDDKQLTDMIAQSYETAPSKF